MNDNLYLINIGRSGGGIFLFFNIIFFSVEPKSQPKTAQLGIFYNVLSRLFTFTTVAMCLFTDFPAQSDRPDVTSEPTCNSLWDISQALESPNFTVKKGQIMLLLLANN